MSSTIPSRLVQQRCHNHGAREAVARCLECGQFFCRECVTEHDDRVICTVCLRKLARKPLTQRRGFILLRQIGQVLAALILAWFFFYIIGETLAAMPDSFHEGDLWKGNWLNE